MPRKSWHLVLSVTAVLTLSACGAADESPQPASSRTASDEDVVTDAATSSVSAVPAEFPDEPIASVPTTVADLELEVYGLIRTGDTVTALYALHNTGTEQATVGNSLGETLANYDASGVSLFDPVGLKRYLVLRDADDRCLCSRIEMYVEAGQRSFYSAALPAPPSDVTSVTFQTPAGSLPALPITEA